MKRYSYLLPVWLSLQPRWMSLRTPRSSFSMTASLWVVEPTPAAGQYKETIHIGQLRNACLAGGSQGTPPAVLGMPTHQTLGCTGVSLSRAGSATPSTSQWQVTPRLHGVINKPHRAPTRLLLCFRWSCDPEQSCTSCDGGRRRHTWLFLQGRRRLRVHIRFLCCVLQKRCFHRHWAHRTDDPSSCEAVWRRFLQVWTPDERKVAAELAVCERWRFLLIHSAELDLTWLLLDQVFFQPRDQNKCWQCTFRQTSDT